ncbi:hypothetical protein JW777_01805 [bacterium]|nr:hypothetical protein [bacterium]
MPIEERMWKIIKRHLGYSDEELKLFRDNARNCDVIEKAQILNKKHIILEVVESHGCNSQHKVGDKIYFDGAGNLLTELSPKKICAYSLANALMLIYTANEMLYAGVDPNTIRFRRTGCFDVGLQCEGWGKIIYELRVEDKP